MPIRGDMNPLTNLPEMVESLEMSAAGVDPGHVSAVEGLREHAPLESGSLDPWLDQGRSCVISLLDRAGPTELREAARALSQQLGSADLPPDLGARVQEWVRLQLVAAGRRGPAAEERTIRAFAGRSRRVLQFLAGAGGGAGRKDIAADLERSHPSTHETMTSHILRDLENADLVRRSRLGREVYVELTPSGRDFVTTHAAPRQPKTSQSYESELRSGLSAFEIHETGQRSVANLLHTYLRGSRTEGTHEHALR